MKRKRCLRYFRTRREREINKKNKKKNSISTRRERKKIKKKENDYMINMKNDDLDSNDNKNISLMSFTFTKQSNIFDNKKKIDFSLRRVFDFRVLISLLFFSSRL